MHRTPNTTFHVQCGRKVRKVLPGLALLHVVPKPRDSPDAVRRWGYRNHATHPGPSLGVAQRQGTGGGGRETAPGRNAELGQDEQGGWEAKFRPKGKAAQPG